MVIETVTVRSQKEPMLSVSSAGMLQSSPESRAKRALEAAPSKWPEPSPVLSLR